MLDDFSLARIRSSSPPWRLSVTMLMNGRHKEHAPARDNVAHYASYLEGAGVTIAEVLKHAAHQCARVSKRRPTPPRHANSPRIWGSATSTTTTLTIPSRRSWTTKKGVWSWPATSRVSRSLIDRNWRDAQKETIAHQNVRPSEGGGGGKRTSFPIYLRRSDLCESPCKPDRE